MYKLTKFLIGAGYPFSILYVLMLSLEMKEMFLIVFFGYFVGLTVSFTFALLVLKSFGKYLDIEE